MSWLRHARRPCIDLVGVRRRFRRACRFGRCPVRNCDTTPAPCCVDDAHARTNARTLSCRPTFLSGEPTFLIGRVDRPQSRAAC